MIEYGRFGLRPLNDGGPDFLARTLLSADISAALSEARRLARVAQSMTDSGRDATETSEKANARLMDSLRLSVELIETSVVTLDGVAVDEDNDDDTARVRKALRRLSRDEWLALTEALQGNVNGATKSDA